MKRIILALVLFSGCPAFAEELKLFTNIYIVPPTFVPTEPERRRTAKEVLVGAGIDFPEGTSALYMPATSQLVVRTTEDRMALVEAYVDRVRSGGEKFAFITVQEFEFAEMPEPLRGWGEPGHDYGIRSGSRLFDKRTSFLNSLSHPPQAMSGTKRGLVGVFTDRQFQALLGKLEEELNLTEPHAMATAKVRSGEPELLHVEGKRWGVVPTIGEDEFTMGLELFLPEHGEAFFPSGPGTRDPIGLSIWDDQTVAWSEEKEDGSYRIVFITGRLVDPAGKPIHATEGQEPPASEDLAR